MKIVQHKQLINQSEAVINSFLSSIPAEDIIHVSFHVHGTESSADEWVAIFYKTGSEQK